MIIIRPAFGAGCVQQSGNAVESQGGINVIDVSVYFSQFGNAGDIPLSGPAPVRRTTCGNVGFQKTVVAHVHIRRWGAAGWFEQRRIYFSVSCAVVQFVWITGGYVWCFSVCTFTVWHANRLIDKIFQTDGTAFGFIKNDTDSFFIRHLPIVCIPMTCRLEEWCMLLLGQNSLGLIKYRYRIFLFSFLFSLFSRWDKKYSRS